LVGPQTIFLAIVVLLSAVIHVARPRGAAFGHSAWGAARPACCRIVIAGWMSLTPF
jgi:hypothetical protein